jgi:transcriptional regulator with XRE-family HTH domain
MRYAHYSRVQMLAEWMEENQVSDRDLAERLGVDYTSVGRIRRGVYRPSWDVLEKLFEVTGGKVTPNSFLSRAAALRAAAA